MLIDIIKKDSINKSVLIRIIDSTSGLPETGVVYNSPGIELWYRRQGGLKVTITSANLTALNDAHIDGGIIHLSDGYYRLDLPDAVCATGVDHVDIGGSVTNMIMNGGRILLTDLNLYSTSWNNLELSAGQMVIGTVSDAVSSPTTTNIPTSITEATADHFKGRVMIFTGGSLIAQATVITGYSLLSGEGVFVVTALTEAPLNTDPFIIV